MTDLPDLGASDSKTRAKSRGRPYSAAAFLEVVHETPQALKKAQARLMKLHTKRVDSRREHRQTENWFGFFDDLRSAAIERACSPAEAIQWVAKVIYDVRGRTLEQIKKKSMVKLRDTAPSAQAVSILQSCREEKGLDHFWKQYAKLVKNEPEIPPDPFASDRPLEELTEEVSRLEDVEWGPYRPFAARD